MSEHERIDCPFPRSSSGPAICSYCGKRVEDGDWRWHGSRMLCWFCEEAD